MSELAVRLAAGAYAGIGAVALVRPALVPAVFGGTATTPESRTEVRAVYGGLPLAIAAVALRRAPEASGRLSAASTVSAGMAAGCLAGAVLERRLRLWPTGAFLLIEVALALALRPRPGSVRRPEEHP